MLQLQVAERLLIQMSEIDRIPQRGKVLVCRLAGRLTCRLFVHPPLPQRACLQHSARCNQLPHTAAWHDSSHYSSAISSIEAKCPGTGAGSRDTMSRMAVAGHA